MRSIAALFWFSIRQTLWQRKIWPTILLLAASGAVALLVRSFNPTSDDLERYHAPLQFMLMTLVMPLVCLLYGTSLIGAEVEGRTIVYLLTRRMRRATVLVIRFVATAVVVTLLIEAALLATHACALAGLDLQALKPTTHWKPAAWEPTRDLFVYLGVVPLAVTAFLALFTAIGLFASKPLALSIGYFVIVELILAAVPVPAQKYTITHQWRATMYEAIPRLKDLWDLPREMLNQLYPTGQTGTAALVGVVLVALALACVLVTRRELVPSKVARE